MPDATRDRYLAELDALLPMPPERRAEILEEIAAHLEDAVAERVERGDPPDAAELSAEARLGRPIDLARDLARPEQSTWRVFAGVGAALRSGIGNWIYGYLFGLLVVFVGSLALSALVQVLGHALGTRWTLLFTDQGWNTMLSTVAAAVGLYWAGRVLPDRFAVHSRRLVSDVRPWVIAVTTFAVLAFTTFSIDAPQNWASVVALTVAPAAIGIGAYLPNLLPGSLRLGVVVIVLVLFAIGMGILTLSSSGASADAIVDEFPDRGLGMVGPEWRPGSREDWEPALATSYSAEVDGVTRWEGEIAPGVSLSTFSDLRLEAWQMDDDHLRIDASEPFATAVVNRDGRSLTAHLDTTNVPGVIHWILILTGERDDGVRYVIDASNGGMSAFTGSVWDWMVAVTNDR